MRGVDQRLLMYRLYGAPRAGQCAAAVRAALAAPWMGYPDATAAGDAVPAGAMHPFHAPRGSIVYWQGGSQNHGHTCFALGDHTLLSVDVIPGAPGTAGVVPYDWVGRHWPRLSYRGWSWWWGSLDTRPEVLTVPGP